MYTRDTSKNIQRSYEGPACSFTLGLILLSELTFRVMSSEQEASKLPVGSHFMAFTSF